MSGYLVVVSVLTLLCCGFAYTVDARKEPRARVVTMLFLNASQAYTVGLSVEFYADSMYLWCIGSTLIFSLNEIQSYQPRFAVILLLFRQLTMWHLAFAYSTPNVSSCVSLRIAAVGLVLTCFMSGEMRDRTKESWGFFSTVRQEREKLGLVLEAIPEGLLVVTAEMKIMCHNERLLEAIGAGNCADLESALARITCKKESEKCESELLLLNSVSLFLSARKSSLTFGVSRLGDHFYEWKGTKCLWEHSEACILTVSHISSWVTAQTRLRQESQAKSSILRFVSHELRTPANAILNMTANVLEQSYLTEEDRTQLSIVVTSTHFLISVVNDLLDYTRIAADKFALVKQSFEIRREVEETTKLVMLQCKQKGLSLRTNFDPLMPDLVYSDAPRMKQVLLNLLGNALKFTFHGGIKVTCTLTERNTVQIAVTDTGIGIPTDKIAGLCKAFGTIDATQRINPQGCGLGLYISNQLAVCLGSKPLQIASNPHSGSEFSFEMAIYQESIETSVVSSGMVEETNEEHSAELTVLVSDLHGGQTSRGPDVLIVDDSEFNRMVLVTILRNMHMQVEEAGSGLRAIAKVRAAMRRGHCYRLIFMDVEMPEMDGLEATREIRAMELMGELRIRPKIICCSAHRGQEDVDRSLAAGMDAYLDKPIARARIETLLNHL